MRALNLFSQSKCLENVLSVAFYIWIYLCIHANVEYIIKLQMRVQDAAQVIVVVAVGSVTNMSNYLAEIKDIFV